MKKSIFLLPIACSLVAAPALAEDEMVEDDGFTPAITVGGFVDASVFMPLAGFGDDGDVWTFGVDQVEVDFTATPAEGLTLQTDLNVFPAAGMTFDDSLLEQGFIDYELDNGYFFTVGKVNAPVGAETVDPTGLYQYSYGQIFGIIPSNLTGFFTGYRGDTIAAQLWVSNDWDVPGGSAAPADKPIIGGRFDYMFSSGHVGLSFTNGPIGTALDGYTMIDVDTAVEVGDLTILGEVHYGTGQNNAHTDPETTNIGALLTLSYAISDVVAATVRGDMLSTSVGDADALTSISGTLAGLFTITDNYGAVVELRADIPDSDLDADTTIGGAVEFLASW